MEATLTREGGALVLTWTAAEDDWVVVGEASGAFAERQEGETGAAVLEDSPAVQDFLAPHLVVSQDGQECTREWLPTRDLLEEGVRIAFTCADEDGPVDVHIDVLTDVNDAYRTVLRTDGSEELLFTSTEPAHELAASAIDAGVESQVGGGQALLLLAVAAAVVVGAVLMGVLMQRSSNRAAPVAGAGS